MSEHRRTTLAAATAVLALPLGWGVGSAKTPKQAVDWVKLNPAFKGATFVNNPETCRTCHADSMKAYAETKHAKAFGVSAPGETGECESCHGPRSNHVENPTSELAMDAVRATSAVCLQCHEGGCCLSR